MINSKLFSFKIVHAARSPLPRHLLLLHDNYVLTVMQPLSVVHGCHCVSSLGLPHLWRMESTLLPAASSEQPSQPATPTWSCFLLPVCSHCTPDPLALEDNYPLSYLPLQLGHGAH